MNRPTRTKIVHSALSFLAGQFTRAPDDRMSQLKLSELPQMVSTIFSEFVAVPFCVVRNGSDKKNFTLRSRPFIKQTVAKMIEVINLQILCCF